MGETSFTILLILAQNEKIGRISAATAEEIFYLSDYLDVSPPTIRKQLNYLCDIGFVRHGIKRGRQNTFYITDMGLKYVKESV